jgi:hypothetical protein
MPGAKVDVALRLRKEQIENSSGHFAIDQIALHDPNILTGYR